MPAKKDFGTRLREKRDGLGWSRAQLARRAGLTPHALYLLERGERTHPRRDTIVGLSRAFGMTVDEFRDEFGMEPSAESPVDHTVLFEKMVKDDPNLRPTEKKSLISVYRSYVEKRR